MMKFQYFGHLIQRINSLETTLMLGKIEEWKRRGWQEDKMVGWHHWLNGREFEQALRNGEGQGSLACCSPWGSKESDMNEQLNNKVRTSYSLFLLSFIQIKPSFLHSSTFFRCWGYKKKDSFLPMPTPAQTHLLVFQYWDKDNQQYMSK